MSTKKGARRKALRYFRWAVKIAFLLAFLLPIKYFADAAIDLPVYSLAYGGLTKPLFTVPYGQSVCSVFLVNWAPDGGWIACPVGGVEVLLTAGNEPQPRLDVPRLLLLTSVAILLFLILVILLGAMFCSWVCPVGTMVDGFDKGVERFMPKTNMKREERMKRNKEKEKAGNSSICPTCFLGKLFNNKHATVANGVLVTALVGSAILRFPIFCTICPIGISAKGMLHLKAWTNITKVGMPIMIEFWIIPVVAVLLSLREKRYWCRKICPLGALIRFVSSFNPFFKPTVKAHNCAMCKSCERICPQLASLHERGSAKCSKCLECYIHCKKDAVEIKWFRTPDAVLSLRSFFKAKLKRICK